MRVDFQNLNEDKRQLFNFRFWLRRAGEWYQRRFGQLEVQVCSGGARWGISFGGGDDGRNVGCHFSLLPGVLTVYATLSRALPRRIFEYNFDRGDDREVAVYFSGGSIWWNFWV